QYMLELVNRARLDPDGEAARYGISLNQSLSAGTISSAAKQVLAPNDLLQDSATDHSDWMLASDTFSHTGAGGSDPGDRMAHAGYSFSGSWTWGENISWRGSTGSIKAGAEIAKQHKSLFLSSGHRTNIMENAFREVGISQELGKFTSGSTTYNASMVTQNFAKSGSKVFLTGVAYSDKDKDDFYSIGEGVGNVKFEIGGSSTKTTGAGGYSLAVKAASGTDVKVTAASGAVSEVRVDLSTGNVKLDLVGGKMFLSSGDLKLVSGVRSAELLGVADLTLRGNGQSNRLVGNDGDNLIKGYRGHDTLIGGDGNDTLNGGTGRDTISGGADDDLLSGKSGSDVLRGNNGNDVLRGSTGYDTLKGGSGDDTIYGGSGKDRIFGGDGNDWIRGDKGDDRLTGGAGADEFVFASGHGTDRITDFEDGIDRIRILAGAADFGDVQISAVSGGDTRVTFADVTIILEDTDPSDIGASDFIFG
ncbi:MAG: CAP domain-containing protein, partial [Albidovulum sp.]|uniref:CAP domain-containing protein n=1 Tax=Albidovulum sp. TaxID=1872424 RepID=UPI003C8A7E50